MLYYVGCMLLVGLHFTTVTCNINHRAFDFLKEAVFLLCVCASYHQLHKIIAHYFVLIQEEKCLWKQMCESYHFLQYGCCWCVCCVEWIDPAVVKRFDWTVAMASHVLQTAHLARVGTLLSWKLLSLLLQSLMVPKGN